MRRTAIARLADSWRPNGFLGALSRTNSYRQQFRRFRMDSTELLCDSRRGYRNQPCVILGNLPAKALLVFGRFAKNVQQAKTS